MLEAYARCPICGRNDKAEKITAIIAGQSHEISGVEQKTEEITNAQGVKQTVVRDVPFTRKQVSILGQRLAPPAPLDPAKLPSFPEPPRAASKNGGISTIVGGVICLILALCGAGVGVWMLFQPEANYTQAEVTNIYITFGVGVGAAGLFGVLGGALIVGGILATIRARKQYPVAVARFQAQVEAVKQEQARILKTHENAIDRWNRLYYCSRDDCVFIPGENTSALLSKMGEYLAQLPPNSSPG